MKTIFLDTETTGLGQGCEIWEIGAILRTNGRDSEHRWQIRPWLQHAEPTGLRIGRYYERNAVSSDPVGTVLALGSVQPGRVEQLAAELAIMLDGATIVGAVPWFDERHIQRFLSEHNQCATNHYHLVDVETLAAGRLGLRPPWDFDKLLAQFDLVYAEADRHTALGDARMVRDLYDAVYDREI